MSRVGRRQAVLGMRRKPVVSLPVSVFLITLAVQIVNVGAVIGKYKNKCTLIRS